MPFDLWIETVRRFLGYFKTPLWKLLDVFIRFGLVLVLAVLCYAIFAPFISLMVWAVILAVTLFPAHQALSRRMNGKPKLAATLIVLSGVVLIVLPTAVLMASFADSVQDLVVGVRNNTIEVPAPSAGTLGEISAKDGETVAVGALLGQINDGAAGAAKPAAAPAKAAAPAAPPAPPPP